MMTNNTSNGITPRQRLFRFALVGALGFTVDASALTLALSLDADFYSGRAYSFICAVTTTWYLNRVYTFSSESANLIREWWGFVSVNAVGGGVNYVTYALLVSISDFFASYPIIAVGAGSLSGLLLNFYLSQRLVFSKKK